LRVIQGRRHPGFRRHPEIRTGLASGIVVR